MKPLRFIAFVFRWFAWMRWDTREGFDAVRRGYDFKSRQILRMRRAEKEPRWTP